MNDMLDITSLIRRIDSSQNHEEIRIRWTNVPGELLRYITWHPSDSSILHQRIVRECRTWSKLKHGKILPLIGLWIGTDHNQGSVSVAFISPWMSGGNLLDFVRQNKDTSSRRRLWFVSYQYRFRACALADPFAKLYNVASALSYSKPSLFIIIKLKAQYFQCIIILMERLCTGTWKQYAFYTLSSIVLNLTFDHPQYNVLIGERKAYLCDFSLSYVSDGVEGCTTMTETPWRWQAPELLGNGQKATPEGDVYAFGCVFLEVCSYLR